MHEPPRELRTEQVLEHVRSLWDPRVDTVEHLPIGFGAWHWRAEVGGEARWFVTLDPPWWHTGDSLEATYAAAASLATALPTVHACVPSAQGRFTSAVGRGRLSLTPWVAGGRPASIDAEAVQAVLDLHASPAPEGILTWEPTVQADLLDELDAWTSEGWTAGPLGEAARSAVRAGTSDIGRGLAAYLDLAGGLDPSTYVPTHGEPGLHNLMRTDDGRLLLLDWETLRLAPRERDLLAGYADLVPHHPDLLDLVRLDWQLGEVRSYADWLRGPHDDDADTRTALGGLREELAGLATAR
ncbi:hypothetical protein SGUI_3144 [Serinicoccus hydrothermalis]|uniref:Aminoglycoside phosphotransferase domain-containing protein n=1 Tax=Serinicoccus hydrothermalis TaxID=1758689 RepID=A0A1B1NGJ8_9MICO|nr:phosphotransferase [Serinicoccus hydrothermalis]ANS80540.1 hypothetical protein SGUI_3144 [Serinicoccus hydrothermalis]